MLITPWEFNPSVHPLLKAKGSPTNYVTPQQCARETSPCVPAWRPISDRPSVTWPLQYTAPWWHLIISCSPLVSDSREIEFFLAITLEVAGLWARSMGWAFLPPFALEDQSPFGEGRRGAAVPRLLWAARGSRWAARAGADTELSARLAFDLGTWGARASPWIFFPLSFSPPFSGRCVSEHVQQGQLHFWVVMVRGLCLS